MRHENVIVKSQDQGQNMDQTLPSHHDYLPGCGTSSRFTEAMDFLFEENLGYMDHKLCICGRVVSSHHERECCRDCNNTIDDEIAYNEAVEQGIIEEDF